MSTSLANKKKKKKKKKKFGVQLILNDILVL